MYLFVGYTPRRAEPYTGGTGHEDYPLDWDRRSRRQVDHRASERSGAEAGARVRAEAGRERISEVDRVRQESGRRGAHRVRGGSVRVRDVSAADESGAAL